MFFMETYVIVLIIIIGVGCCIGAFICILMCGLLGIKLASNDEKIVRTIVSGNTKKKFPRYSKLKENDDADDNDGDLVPARADRSRGNNDEEIDHGRGNRPSYYESTSRASVRSHTDRYRNEEHSYDDHSHNASISSNRTQKYHDRNDQLISDELNNKSKIYFGKQVEKAEKRHASYNIEELLNNSIHDRYKLHNLTSGAAEEEIRRERITKIDPNLNRKYNTTYNAMDKSINTSNLLDNDDIINRSYRSNANEDKKMARNKSNTSFTSRKVNRQITEREIELSANRQMTLNKSQIEEYNSPVRKESRVNTSNYKNQEVVPSNTANQSPTRSIYDNDTDDDEDSIVNTTIMSTNDPKKLLRGEIETQEFQHIMNNINMEKENNKLIGELYSEIKDFKMSKDDGLKKGNTVKNRYKDITPYDMSRVKLSEIEGVSNSDYINASHVHDYKYNDVYIAAQGPKENTCVDFWRMIFEYGISDVVMLTNCMQKDKKGKDVVKCQQYWPTTKKHEYTVNDPNSSNVTTLTVKFLEETKFANYIIRTFNLIMSIEDIEEFETKKVLQWQYTTWPDHDTPAIETSLLDFITKVYNSNPQKMVVHCSAGVGRTGTFITIGEMIKMIKTENKLSIYSFVKSLRGKRMQMVQTQDQYMCIYKALNEFLICQNLQLSADNIDGSVSEYTENPVLLKDEFTLMVSRNINSHEFSIAEGYLESNRSYEYLPYDNNIVNVLDENENMYYINASYIDSYVKRYQIIATQFPIDLDVFWLMVWTEKTPVIVALITEEELTNENLEWYFPTTENQTITYGHVTVKLCSITEDAGIITSIFEVGYDDEVSNGDEDITIYHYRYANWNIDHDIPNDIESFLNTVNCFQLHQKDSKGRAIVHCIVGAGRTGIFIGLNSMIQAIRMNNEVDVFIVARVMNQQRYMIVKSKEQYLFFFTALNAYFKGIGK